MNKKCTKCGITKHINKFWEDKRRPDGRRTSCVKCNAIWNRNTRNNRKAARGVEYSKPVNLAHSAGLRYCIGIYCRGEKLFKSTWIGHRVCDRCLSQTNRTWQDGIER